MKKKQWYQELFENYADSYERECFTAGTAGECDFIEQEIDFNKGLRILDVGCGTGRHAIELARRRYRVTGIDLSASMLRKAAENASRAGVEVRFQQADARELPFSGAFDVALMLCEGGFPLMETDEMNFEILKQVSKALVADGLFIFTTLNGLFPLYHSVEAFCAAEKGETKTTYRSNSFDLMTFRDHNITEIEDDSGKMLTLECNERYYVPSEITWLLKTLGWKRIEIFGAKLGAFSRDDKLTTEDFEMLVIARSRTF
ncbi:MAG TPA: class I SAM-dependent methyltransferase [Bacteroidales bacterium]|nr:class I SAM-dependent methyltransferase [Bacteroidales bacterium]HSA44115.1 class I SAM-dependent methyltransferase [Bacteroidales bacterium]